MKRIDGNVAGKDAEDGAAEKVSGDVPEQVKGRMLDFKSRT